MTIQVRLQDAQGEYPAPPPGLDLRDPRSGEPLQHQDPAPHDNLQAPTASMGSTTVSQLQAAAAAAQTSDLGQHRDSGQESYRDSSYKPDQPEDTKRFSEQPRK